jgi:hypothetical protein
MLKHTKKYLIQRNFSKIAAIMASNKEDAIRYIQSRYHNCFLLIHKNYIYQKAKTNKDGSQNWRCERHNKQENKSTVTCRVFEGRFVREPIEHNHPPVNDNVNAMHECVNAIKEKVVENKGSMKRMFENTVCKWI